MWQKFSQITMYRRARDTETLDDLSAVNINTYIIIKKFLGITWQRVATVSEMFHGGQKFGQVHAPDEQSNNH